MHRLLIGLPALLALTCSNTAAAQNAARETQSTVAGLSRQVAPHASMQLPADALLSVDMNRSDIVQRVYESWAKQLPVDQSGLFRQSLSGLRADRLLAASLAGSVDAVLEILVAQDSANGSLKARASGVQKAIGEVDRDLVYTPISPCRFIETRTVYPNFGIPYYGAGQFAPSEIRNYVVGSACGLPSGVAAIQAQVQGQATGGIGANLEATRGGGPFGGGITLVAAFSPLFTVVSAAVPLNLGTNSIGIQVTANSAHVVMDVVGYYMPASRNGDGLRIFGGGTGTPTVVNGDDNNTATAALAATIGGGGGTGTVAVPEAAVISYAANAITGAAHASVIAGGTGNQIEYNAISRPVFATISGGQGNRNYAYFGVIGGGRSNTAGQAAVNIFGATAAGGFGNLAFGSYGTVSGGSGNQAGPAATVPGGESNLALGAYSLAAGRSAYTANDASGTIRHAGAFAWADSNANAVAGQQFFTSADDQFAVRARGGVAFRVVSTTSAASGAGCSLPAGGAASWSCSSDRNLKEGILAISPKAVLAKVSALPLSTWQFKGTTRRHLSPMAQDFWAAFGLGENDTNITSSDVGGVALAAVQGLNQKMSVELRSLKRAMDAKSAELDQLRRDLAEIRRQLKSK
jgi:Chaperone of endosialidase